VQCGLVINTSCNSKRRYILCIIIKYSHWEQITIRALDFNKQKILRHLQTASGNLSLFVFWLIMSSTTYKSPGSPSFRETTTTPPGSSGFRESTTPTGFPDFRTSTITPDLPNFRETTTPPGFPDFQTSTTSPGFPNYQNSTPGNNLTSESMSTDSPAGGNSPSQRDSTSISDNEEAEQEADLPLTMAASVILTQLPKDAKTALEGVAAGGVLGGGKGAVADKGM
jgi:hypothetical protein